jgi:hypothetical protein
MPTFRPKKKYLQKLESIGEFDMQCANKFFSIQMVPSKCNHTWMKYTKKHFSDPCLEIEMNILTSQHIKNWSVHYLPWKDNMALVRYLTPLKWLFWEITCPNPIRQYILVIFLYSCWLIPLLRKVVCFVIFLL